MKKYKFRHISYSRNETRMQVVVRNADDDGEQSITRHLRLVNGQWMGNPVDNTSKHYLARAQSLYGMVIAKNRKGVSAPPVKPRFVAYHINPAREGTIDNDLEYYRQMVEGLKAAVKAQEDAQDVVLTDMRNKARLFAGMVISLILLGDGNEEGAA